MMKYSDQLRDPRWQRKRLEIMQRDGFKCRRCKTDSEPLHVHHCFYKKGEPPWSYPSQSLITLCDSCHKLQHEIGDCSSVLINLLKQTGFCETDFEDLVAEIFPRLADSEPLPKRLLAAVSSIERRKVERP